MTPMRRRILLATASSAALASRTAYAQSGLPIRLLVGFAPGGTVDLTARALAEAMRPALGRPVIVENRPGAAGRLVLEAVKAAVPDGDTLMLVPHGPMTLFQWIYRQLRYDPIKDFSPVGRVCVIDYALAVGAGASARALPEYIAWARANPGKASFGSPGAGTVPHFLGVGFAQRAGFDLAHVPYKGAAPALVDLVGGNISLMVSPLSDPIEAHRAGKARILAVTGSQRNPDLPDIPTLRETGIDLVLDGWLGLYAPAATPAGKIAVLHEAMRSAVSAIEPTLRRLTILGLTASPQELARLQATESLQWERWVKASGFTPEG